MKQTVLLIITLTLYSCVNSGVKTKSTINEFVDTKNAKPLANSIVYDTCRIQKELDSLFFNLNPMEEYPYSIVFSESYYEGQSYEYFYFDSLLNLRKQVSDNAVEGYYGNRTRFFNDSKLSIEIDTSGYSNYEKSDSRMHHKLGLAKGITNNYVLDVDVYTGEIKSIELRKVVITATDVKQKENETYKMLAHTYRLIKGFRDSAQYHGNKIIIESTVDSGDGFNYYYKFNLDSLLFNEILETKMK